MKHIFLQIQEKLGEVSALKYIDKDWNQLKFEQPPVKWPCALIDVKNINYSQMGNFGKWRRLTWRSWWRM